ncbi:MAG: hypothetical protein KKE76_08060 [Gammaproteobacteria bacterium]|nr:hypothetical protein [Gammaproteobacteria bacterium]
MTSALSIKAARKEGISWLLILAFLSLTLFPHHYHLHHAAEAQTHDVGIQDHVIDIHGHADASGFNHHDDGHTIKPATDVSIKKSGVQLQLVIILLALLLIIPIVAQNVRQHPRSVKHRLPLSSLYTTPPLRAPPRT